MLWVKKMLVNVHVYGPQGEEIRDSHKFNIPKGLLNKNEIFVDVFQKDNPPERGEGSE